MKNKIMISIIIFIFVFSVSAFSIDIMETAVTLPNGTSASDVFDEFQGNKFNQQRWSANSWSKWKPEPGYAIARVRNQNDNDYAFLYQPFDYNSGSLKSDYYHFQTTINADYLDSLKKGGLMISDTNVFDPNTSLNISLYDNWLRSDSTTEIETHEVGTAYNTSYTFDIYLERDGNTNTFDITATAADQGGEPLLIHTYKGTLDKIYVCLWSDRGGKAKFDSFEAYTTGANKDAVSISGLIQNGDEMGISWDVNPSSYKDVQIVYSKDDVMTFLPPDLNVYKGTSDKTSIIYPISSSMKDGIMYFGIKGSDIDIESDPAEAEHIYLKPVNTFIYSHTTNTNEYTFNWNEVFGATGYQITNGSDVIDLYSTTATISDITNPENVTIVATKNASTGPGVSKSPQATATPSLLEDFGKLWLTYNENTVSFEWDAFAGAESYMLLKRINDSYVPVEIDILNTNITIDYSNLEVISQYVVKAIVNDVKSQPSNVVDVKSKVKGLTENYEASSSQIALDWQGIDDAEKYKIYVSDSNDMSSADVFESGSTNYVYDVSHDYTGIKYFQVEALNANGVSLKSDIVSVDLSAVENSENVIIKVNGVQTSIEDKKYNSPMEFDVTYKIKEQKLYNTVLSINLDNILLNGVDIETVGGSETLMNYIYPEIVDFKLLSEYPEKEDGSSEIAIDYLAQIQSKGKGGYKINIIITDPLISEKLTFNRIMKISVKTDLRFHNDAKDYILKNGNQIYTWMELPFYIEDQLEKADSELTLSNVSGGLKIDANIFFDVTDINNLIGSNSVFIGIPINFINRNLAPGE